MEMQHLAVGSLAPLSEPMLGLGNGGSAPRTHYPLTASCRLVVTNEASLLCRGEGDSVGNFSAWVSSIRRRESLRLKLEKELMQVQAVCVDGSCEMEYVWLDLFSLDDESVCAPWSMLDVWLDLIYWTKSLLSPSAHHNLSWTLYDVRCSSCLASKQRKAFCRDVADSRHLAGTMEPLFSSVSRVGLKKVWPRDICTFESQPDDLCEVLKNYFGF